MNVLVDDELGALLEEDGRWMDIDWILELHALKHTGTLLCLSFSMSNYPLH